MTTGAISLIALVGFAQAAMVRSFSATRGAFYQLSALLFVVLLSGLPGALGTSFTGPGLELAQAVMGPISGALANFWMRDWLAARKRDRVMELGLRLAGWACLAAAVALLFVTPDHRLPAAAIVTLTDIGIVLWLSVRASLLGDRLAAGIALGCLLMLPAAAGLFLLALRLYPVGVGWQVFTALCSVACLSVIGAMVWQRARDELRAQRLQTSHADFDPLTKVYNSGALVQRLLKAQRRRRRTRRYGAMLAVMAFDTERLAATLGTQGRDEAYLHLVARLRREVGVVNIVGRYYDRCFIALLESVHSPTDLRTVGLRVAVRCRRPMEIHGLEGDAHQVRLDIGVGIVPIADGFRDVDDLLHDAQRLAEAARGLRSRAALLDMRTGQPVPVEQAPLGDRWSNSRATQTRPDRLRVRTRRA